MWRNSWSEKTRYDPRTVQRRAVPRGQARPPTGQWCHVARGRRRAASVVRGNMVGTRLVSLVLVLCGIEGAASLSPNLRPAAPPDLNEPYWPVSRNCQICSMLLVPLPPSCPRALCTACLAMRLLCLCPPEHRRLTSTPQAFALPALAALWASTPHPRTDVRLAGLRCSHA